MASIHALVVHPSPLKAFPPDPVAYAARDIELAAIDLMRAVDETTDSEGAMRLWKIVRILEQEISRVTAAAADRVDALGEFR